jgi:hypothetical protein
VNPVAQTLSPGTLHASIISYEHMPRYTDRSTGFEHARGRWEAKSPVKESNGVDGTVSKSLARAYMEDLRAWLERPEIRRYARQKAAFYRKLRNHLDEGRIEEARALLLRIASKEEREAVVRDVIEIQQRNLPHSLKNARLSLDDFKLAPITATEHGSNKLALMTTHPQWKNVLSEPAMELVALFAKKDYATIGALVDAVHDSEFEMYLYKFLGGWEFNSHDHYLEQQSPKNATKVISAEKRKLIRAIIESKNERQIENLLRHTFIGPVGEVLEDEIKMILRYLATAEAQKRDRLIPLFVDHVLSPARARAFEPWLLELARDSEKGNPTFLRNVVPHLFMQETSSAGGLVMTDYQPTVLFGELEHLAEYYVEHGDTKDVVTFIEQWIDEDVPPPLKLLDVAAARAEAGSPLAYALVDGLRKERVALHSPFVRRMIAISQQDSALGLQVARKLLLHPTQTPLARRFETAVREQDPIARKAQFKALRCGEWLSPP